MSVCELNESADRHRSARLRGSFSVVCAADQLIRCLGLNSGGKALISPPPRLSAANGDPFRGKHGEPISCAPRSAAGTETDGRK